MYSCTFTTPDDAPETATWQPIDCTPKINAFLVPLCESHGVLLPASEAKLAEIYGK